MRQNNFISSINSTAYRGKIVFKPERFDVAIIFFCVANAPSYFLWKGIGWDGTFEAVRPVRLEKRKTFLQTSVTLLKLTFLKGG